MLAIAFTSLFAWTCGDRFRSHCSEVFPQLSGNPGWLVDPELSKKFGWLHRRIELLENFE
jgi:hypothetical protein